LPPDEAEHGPLPEERELRSGSSPWSVGPPVRTVSLRKSARCDVAIVGSGITGSLCAEALSRVGKSVIVVDRLPPATLSTAASTSMLLWELDVPLAGLAASHGFDKAARLYKRSLAAVDELGKFIAATGIDCGFAPRRSLYLADDAGAADLEAEHGLRREAGLPGKLLSSSVLESRFGMRRPCAILSSGAAEADPLCLARSVLAAAQKRGALVVRDEVVSYAWDAQRVSLELAEGREIEAGHVVLATGYDMPDFLDPSIHKVQSTWCFATAPGSPDRVWPERALLWEAADPYLYARTTPAGRIIVGGEDEATADTAARQALSPAKVERLLAKMRTLWPEGDYAVEHRWSAAFGITDDGLPLIGRVPGAPRLLAAYGYGGNGITFSFLASRVLAATIAGENRAWFDDFAIDRDPPSGA
jgi:glycine/D-amino acid oxidase-like deaminating enzyme